MTTKLVWRLKEQPTTESLRELVKDKILTNEEARQILFSSEEEKKRDIKSLEEEIKFLRELIEKLSNRSQIVEVIKEIKTPYSGYQWYEPYKNWYDNPNIVLCSNNVTSMSGVTTMTDGSFTSINTF